MLRKARLRVNDVRIRLPMWTKLWKKGDVLLFIVSFFVCICSFFLCWKPIDVNQATAIVLVDGQEHDRYSLSIDRTIVLDHNTLCIDNGQIYMVEADCPDHLCVHQGAISNSGMIVCLPNRVVVRISDEPYDAWVG